MSLPKEVHIQECCPRDGWQNHAEFIPTEVKIKYIRRMIDRQPQRQTGQTLGKSYHGNHRRARRSFYRIHT